MTTLHLQLDAMQRMVEAFRLDLATKMLIAVLAGGAIGLERQIAGKPAGLRTNILICVGSALLMDLSINIGVAFGGPRIGDPARLAAQVVTGIGFIGAGTIMQSHGTITGLTSAATIWVVAAIGLTVGGGFYVEALGATATVMLVLAGMGTLEHRLLRAQRTLSATIRARPNVSLEWLEKTLRADGLTISRVKTFDHEHDRVFELRMRGPARQFDIVRVAMSQREEVLDFWFD